MAPRTTLAIFTALTASSLAFATPALASPAFAQEDEPSMEMEDGAEEEESDDASSEEEASEDEAMAAPEEKSDGSPLLDPEKRIYGAGLRLRYVGMPQGVIELFVEEAASGAGAMGFGLDFVTRKNEVEFSVGFEYDPIAAEDGYYVENGGDPQTFGTTDFVEFKDLSWFTIDATLVYHTALNEQFSLRYGGGIGFGIVSGDVLKTDALCTGQNAQTDCMPVGGGEFMAEQDFFRFPPVINLLAGAQYTPTKELAINFDIGMRTLLYTGINLQYFFK